MGCVVIADFKSTAKTDWRLAALYYKSVAAELRTERAFKFKILQQKVIATDAFTILHQTINIIFKETYLNFISIQVCSNNEVVDVAVVFLDIEVFLRSKLLLQILIPLYETISQ